YGITTFVVGTPGVCKSVSDSPSVAPPQVPGATVTFTASSTCVGALYQFWLLPPGGSWTIKQPFSTTASWPWNTTGYALGTYQVGVWAKAGTSTNSYDAFFIRTYQLDVGMCTAGTISAAPASPQSTGTITLTATAVGCTTPSFEFWELPPGGAWAVTQAYSATSTHAWVITGIAKGPYQVGVWVR